MSQPACVCFCLVQLDKVCTIWPQGLAPLEITPILAQRENLFMSERWLSVEEIAAHLGVKPDTIYKWIGHKKMPAHKVGWAALEVPGIRGRRVGQERQCCSEGGLIHGRL